MQTVKRASARREGEADEPQPESTELDEKFERFMVRSSIGCAASEVSLWLTSNRTASV